MGEGITMKQVKKSTCKQATANTATLTELTKAPEIVITSDNIRQLAKQVAMQALSTIHKNSGNDTIRKMMLGIIFDDDTTEGVDIVSALTVVLCQLVGKKLFTDFVPTDIIIDDGNGYELLAVGKKDQQPLTIWRSCLRLVNTIVFTNKRQAKKTVYLEEIDDDGNVVGYTEIPTGFDCDSLDEWDWYDYVVQALQLTPLQKKCLKARFWQGCSIEDTAKKASTSKGSAYKALQAIGKKYGSLYDSITPYQLDYMLDPPTSK